MMVQKQLGTRYFGAIGLRVPFATQLQIVMLRCRIRASRFWTDALPEHLNDPGKLKGPGTARTAFPMSNVSSGQSNPSLHRQGMHKFVATPPPRRDELPTWVATLMDDPALMSRSIPHIRSVVRKTALIGLDSVTQCRTEHDESFYLCCLAVHVGAETYPVRVRAVEAQKARETAWLHIIAKLHLRGKLDSPEVQNSVSLTPKGSPNARCTDTIENLVDVYRHCAMIGILPEIKLRKDTNTGLFEYTIAWKNSSYMSLELTRPKRMPARVPLMPSRQRSNEAWASQYPRIPPALDPKKMQHIF